MKLEVLRCSIRPGGHRAECMVGKCLVSQTELWLVWLFFLFNKGSNISHNAVTVVT